MQVAQEPRSTPASPSAAVDAGEPRLPLRLFALKHGDTFLVADAFGDIGGEGDGLFRDDTRVLSRFALTLGGHLPSLLGARISQDNVFFTCNLTNRPLPPLGGAPVPEGVLHIERTRFLWETRLYERLTITNYAELEAVAPLGLSFAADFRDMFEVRGRHREARGRPLPTELTAASLTLGYAGLDGIVRTCSLAFSQPPDALTATRAEILVRLGPRERREIYLEVGPNAPALPSRARFRAAAARARVAIRARRRGGAAVRSSGRLFNEWLHKSRADLALLTTELPTGPYPYAGIPWFSTPFGRDAIIAALQTLWLDPPLARGVLAFLAEHQAEEVSPFQDAAPGKILHERRKGEMATLRELPFARYYGGVDTTPLFVMLAGAYAGRTGDLAFIDTLWPSLLAAMAWIEGEGDSNRDGFLDYARAADTGLANQGWKDSHDSVFHADGSEARGPIALVEVQGYVYAALHAMADLAGHRGEPGRAATWRARARALRDAVESRFWLEGDGYYALALDGEGEPCRVRGSNAGHLLFTGLPSARRAERVAAHLRGLPFSSGWGIRTLASGQARFNPMSYHNGSVWPHDTALCAAGLARYGARDDVVRLMSGMFETAVHFDMRLPELFCGFDRKAGEAPTGYPVACLPQAWAAGAAFMMLQACLGVTVDGVRGEIHIDRPRLPIGIDRLTILHLTVGAVTVDLTFQRLGNRVTAFPEGLDPSPVPVILHA
ncbi:amylo-alpha-1,6-glucosidase [Marinimicrococcus flavescens]|uniref:Amylo-alpha-1,6-glucosidase n=1 Tax=Marinimicrococcus flavescens TaxID=3031815 RepID=A0AAP3XQ05_9PROT|nr:amylo-alpha-1,6-glucosidase [Marinimicrococcus flavescens]